MVCCQQEWMWCHVKCLWCHACSACGFIRTYVVMSLVKWDWLHRYIGYHARYSRCVVIHSAGEISYTLSIMSKTLQVSCHSYSGCDVTSVVYVMSYAEEVVKKELLHETIPRFGLPRSLQSDNGTSFTSKVTQGVSLSSAYYLHCAWRPQSSGKVGRANQFLKSAIKS